MKIIYSSIFRTIRTTGGGLFTGNSNTMRIPTIVLIRVPYLGQTLSQFRIFQAV